MSVIYCESTKTFYLEGRDVTYAFYINAIGYPEQLYFGRRVARDRLQYTFALGAHSMRTCLIDSGVSLGDLPCEVPTYGMGDFREPMLACRTQSGDRLTQFVYEGHEIVHEKPCPAGMPALRGGETLILHLKDACHDIAVDAFYTVYEDTSAIVRRVEIRNTGDTPVMLDRAYSFSLDLPRNDYELISLHGAWARECEIERVPMHHGIYAVDSKRGSSSATNNPFLAAVSPATDELHGDAYGFNLIWSGSYVLKAEANVSGASRILGGVQDFDFCYKLAAGETFATPEAVLVYSANGLSGMSQQFHDTYRSYLIPAHRVYSPRPVVINSWEGVYFTFDNKRLMEIVDTAKGTGIDTFVLDDGWFGVRNDSKSGLGDWFVNTDKLEGGLHTIIDYVHAADMKFGLWFEPEMINPDSDLYRAHPDWAIHCPGHTQTVGRNQMVLDLTRAEVRDYVVEVVSKILREHDIDYVKWDSNRAVTENFSVALDADRQQEFNYRWTLGLYDICERIIGGFPDIFFEGCSSGGARFDAGMLYYFPQIWTSDDTDAYMRTRIQYGTSLAYPLSSLSCHVSICPNHQTGRVTPFASRADIAHLGATGYELDTARINEQEIAAIPAQVATYRDMEELILRGDVYRLSNTLDSNYFVEQIVAKDRSRAVLTAMRALSIANDELHRIHPVGLDEDALYHIPELDLTLHGSTIMHVGIRLPFAKCDFATFTVHFEKQ